MRLRAPLFMVAAALLLPACQPKPPRTPPPVPRPPTPTALAPTEYVAMAASVDLFVVKSSELAQTRSPGSRLGSLERMLIAAHNGTAAQLSFAGRRLNLLPSATLLPVHRSMLGELEASADFDKTYRRQQVQVHEMAVKLHSDFAARGTSPTLRPVAASAVRIERAHLDELRSF